MFLISIGKQHQEAKTQEQRDSNKPKYYEGRTGTLKISADDGKCSFQQCSC